MNAERQRAYAWLDYAKDEAIPFHLLIPLMSVEANLPDAACEIYISEYCAEKIAQLPPKVLREETRQRGFFNFKSLLRLILTPWE